MNYKKSFNFLKKLPSKLNSFYKRKSKSGIKVNNKSKSKKEDPKLIIESLKNLFEDTWKKLNEINTSIKLPIIIKIKNENLKKSNNFELDVSSIFPFELQKVDEIFITNVIQGIVAVTKYRKKFYVNEISKMLLKSLNLRLRIV